MAVLSLRALEDARFGFVPTREEWRIGVQHFCVFPADWRGAGLLVAAGTISSAARFAWWKFRALLVATFCGDLMGGVAGRGVLLSRLPATRASHAARTVKPWGCWPPRCFSDWRIFPFENFPNWRRGDRRRRAGICSAGWLADESAQRAGQHGDARAGGHYLADVFYDLSAMPGAPDHIFFSGLLRWSI